MYLRAAPPRDIPTPWFSREHSQAFVSQVHLEMTYHSCRRGLHFGSMAASCFSRTCLFSQSHREKGLLSAWLSLPPSSFTQHPTDSCCGSVLGKELCHTLGTPRWTVRRSSRKTVTTRRRRCWTQEKPRVQVSTSDQSLNQVEWSRSQGSLPGGVTLVLPSIQLLLTAYHVLLLL